MSNIFTVFAGVGPVDMSELSTPVYFESAVPEDIARDLNAVLDTLVAADEDLFDLSLTGSGDGHKFLAVLTSRDVAQGTGVPSKVFTYMAADATELAVQYAAALAAFRALYPSTFLATKGHTVVGASQGLRKMGIVVMQESVG